MGGPTEITQLDVHGVQVGDENIFWLDVTMYNVTILKVKAVSSLVRRGNEADDSSDWLVANSRHSSDNSMPEMVMRGSAARIEMIARTCI